MYLQISLLHVIVKLTNSNLDLEILNAESELAEKQDMLRNTHLSKSIYKQVFPLWFSSTEPD